MSSTRHRRLESKRRKVAAFLEVARLNDADVRTLRPSVKRTAVDESIVSPSSKTPRDDHARPPSDMPQLSGDDYETLRARLRERKKALMQLPKFELKSQGHDASVENPSNLRTPLFLSDLQHVLAYTMVGDRSPYQPFSWCKMEKWNKLTNVMCLVVEGLSVADFLENREDSNVSQIDAIFPSKLEFLSASVYDSSTAKDLSILPVTRTKRKMLAKKYGSVDHIEAEGEAFVIDGTMFPLRNSAEESAKKVEGLAECLKLRLLLSARQMVEENYPLPLNGKLDEKFSDYVMTKDSYMEAHPDSPMFSVDCEMCLTTAGKPELTRICVVDKDLNVIYHSLVKPHNAIKNYLTRFSGITEEILADVTTRLSDVQTELRRLLPADCILVGQSLNCDLHALRMMHPYVIDTSVIYNITGVRRRKTKLSVLSSLFLGQIIQNNEDGKKGHSPIEDAQAAMKLVNLKLEKGYEYGDVLLNGTVPNLEADNKKKEEDSKVLGMSILDLISRNEKKIGIICQLDLKDEYSEIPSCESFLCQAASGKEAVDKACQSAFENNLTICHVKVCPEKEAKIKFKEVRKFTKKLWSHTSENGLFFTVWSGQKTENALVGIAMKRSGTK